MNNKDIFSILQVLSAQVYDSHVLLFVRNCGNQNQSLKSILDRIIGGIIFSDN